MDEISSKSKKYMNSSQKTIIIKNAKIQPTDTVKLSGREMIVSLTCAHSQILHFISEKAGHEGTGNL